MTSIRKFASLMVLAAMFTIGSVVPGFAGAVGGSKYDSFNIRPYSAHSFTVAFRGGEFARVYVKGDGAADIDLFVYDQYGRCVAYDNDNSEECFVEWVPTYTATYIIKVVNRSGRYSDYAIVTN